LPRGILEQRERLEQVRALEAGMRFSVSLIDKARLGVQVDTPADLARARELMRAPSYSPVGNIGDSWCSEE
jgi:3-deoxy-manno-octulosonate cytidylyltransferase (CMP-KDO synthetase)